MDFSRIPPNVIWGRQLLYQHSNSSHSMVRWSKPLMIGTRLSHSYFRVLMTLSVTEIDPCFPTAPNGAGFCFLLSFSQNFKRCRSVSGLWSLKDIANSRGWDKDIQESQLVCYPNPPPVDVWFYYLPYQNCNFYGCFIGWNTGLLLIFDLMQPPVESISGDAKYSVALRPGIWYVSICQRMKSFSRRVYRGFFCFFLIPFWRIDTCICSCSTMFLRKMISLSLAFTSMAARRFKLRFRTMPENRAAITTALMMM